jgi:hypothetical protein
MYSLSMPTGRRIRATPAPPDRDVLSGNVSHPFDHRVRFVADNGTPDTDKTVPEVQREINM